MNFRDQANERLFLEAWTRFKETDCRPMRAAYGEWLIEYLEEGRPVPAHFSTLPLGEILQRLVSMRVNGWRKLGE